MRLGGSKPNNNRTSPKYTKEAEGFQTRLTRALRKQPQPGRSEVYQVPGNSSAQPQHSSDKCRVPSNSKPPLTEEQKKKMEGYKQEANRRKIDREEGNNKVARNGQGTLATDSDDGFSRRVKKLNPKAGEALNDLFRQSVDQAKQDKETPSTVLPTGDMKNLNNWGRALNEQTEIIQKGEKTLNDLHKLVQKHSEGPNNGTIARSEKQIIKEEQTPPPSPTNSLRSTSSHSGDEGSVGNSSQPSTPGTNSAASTPRTNSTVTTIDPNDELKNIAKELGHSFRKCSPEKADNRTQTPSTTPPSQDKQNAKGR